MRKSKIRKIEPLHPHEWKFDAIPEAEVQPCFRWEFGRTLFKTEEFQSWAKQENVGLKYAEALKRKDTVGDCEPLLTPLITKVSEYPSLSVQFFLEAPPWQAMSQAEKTVFSRFNRNEIAENMKAVGQKAAIFRLIEPGFDVSIRTGIAALDVALRSAELGARAAGSSNSGIFLAQARLLVGAFEPEKSACGSFAIDWDEDKGKIESSFRTWLDEEYPRRNRKDCRTRRRGGANVYQSRLLWIGHLRRKDYYGKLFKEFCGGKANPALDNGESKMRGIIKNALVDLGAFHF